MAETTAQRLEALERRLADSEEVVDQLAALFRAARIVMTPVLSQYPGVVKAMDRQAERERLAEQAKLDRRQIEIDAAHEVYRDAHEAARKAGKTHTEASNAAELAVEAHRRSARIR